jgi:hypothetical protein
MLEVLTECVRNNMQWDISRTEYTTHNTEQAMLFDADDDDDAACLKLFIWTLPTVIIFCTKPHILETSSTFIFM